MLTKWGDHRVKECLRVLNAEQFAPLMDALRQENGARIATLLVAQDERLLRNTQGAAQFIDEFLRLVAEAVQ